MKHPINDWWLWLAALLLLTAAMLASCDQRQVKYYEYDENTGIHREWEYKANRLASEQELDWLHLDMPGKGKLFFGPYKLDNDSMKLYTPYGIVETDKGETK
jgi:hypothetical protein